MAGTKKNEKRQIMPVLPLRGLTVFPYMELHFDVGREISVKALEAAMMGDQRALLVTQRDARDDDPDPNGLYQVGTIARVKQLVRISPDAIRVRIEGIMRGEALVYLEQIPFFRAEVVERGETNGRPNLPKNGVQIEALRRQVFAVFEEYVKLNGKISPDSIMNVIAIEDPGQLTDVIAANLFLKTERKQELLEIFQPVARLEALLRILTREIEVLTIEREIGAKVRRQVDKSQREYYLREQLKVISGELGEREGLVAEVEEYREKLAAKNLPEEVAQKAEKELDRLSKMMPGFAETTVVRNYLDWLIDLPWTEKTEESRDISAAERILAEDHYGLEKVKERILEYLAVRMYKDSLKGPILCLIGPPGVGKTSIAKSVARALNRKYVRMSLGGVRDEAEIRGHRRTYIGAIPGRIIAALKQAGTKNPLILLDEIDKMSSDFRGDPASAMLEVLDSEQNFAFRDHYMELPFDLSDVMFMTTANSADTIPRPLYDRMEIIQISGYTEEEKVRIALDFLIPKQLTEHGATKREIRFDERGVRDLINYYTRESGVRTLEREIASLCRKSVRLLTGGGQTLVRITPAAVPRMLGVHKFRYEKAAGASETGIARGLAWTPVGGETLSVEVNVMPGTGKLELTGQLGNVMK
ncbi:MAG: endopeptidase La, partial [Clostridiales bacterium]|nr:endopeptidase La [Clostridiales bacterium]